MVFLCLASCLFTSLALKKTGFNLWVPIGIKYENTIWVHQ